MKINTMVDPSLLAESSLKGTREMILSQEIDYINFHVPRTVKRAYLWENGEIAKEQIDRFYGSRSNINSEHVAEFLSYEGEGIREFEASDYSEQYSYLYDRLLKTIDVSSNGVYESPYSVNGNVLADILFEELTFSLERSPIISRIKKIYKNFKQILDYGTELSDRILEETKSYSKERWEDAKNQKQALMYELERSAQQRNGHEDPVTRTTLVREAVKEYSPRWVIDTVKGAPSILLASLFTGSYAVGAGLAGLMVGSRIGTFIADP